jgi:uncharacterized protein YdbL (DUF1318 family)
MGGESPRQWLLLTYRVPSEPTRFRAYVWRQVKSLGCLYLQQAICLLPNRPNLDRQFQQLVSKIEEFGGEATLLTATSRSAEWEAKVVAGFNAMRDEEYAEIAENEERFEDEVRRETRKKKFTFAELEDLEADWEKIGRWMEKVRERDFFGATRRQETEARLVKGKKLLEEFTRKVYARQGVEGPTGAEEPKDDAGR